MQPTLRAKFEGLLPSKTWNTYIEVGFSATNSGDARYFLRELMANTREEVPPVIMIQHGREKWTSNIHRDDTSLKNKPYKTKLELRIYANDRHRAKQELVKMLEYWMKIRKKYNIYRVHRFGDDWSD